MKKTRQSNIELLRIFAMCGVIILHYNNETMGGGFTHVADGSVNQAILYGLEGLFVCAVNLFVLITGYFSCTSQKRDPVKVIGLLMQVVAFRMALYLYYDVLKAGAFSIRGFLMTFLPANYFVVLYAGVYLLSPYINLVLKKLSKAQLRSLVVMMAVLLSVLPTLADVIETVNGGPMMGLNPVSAFGDDFGYTLVNFVLMYVIGAYIRLADIRLKKRYSAAACVVLTVALAVTGKMDTTSIAWSYCNPLVIAQAVTLFLLFRQMKFNSKVVNELSKGAFTCFLFHSILLYKIGIPSAVQLSPVLMLGHVLICSAGIYLASYVVYKVYDFVAQPILRLVGKLMQKCRVDFSVEEEV